MSHKHPPSVRHRSPGHSDLGNPDAIVFHSVRFPYALANIGKGFLERLAPAFLNAFRALGCHYALWIADQIGQDVFVQQIRRRCTHSNTSSTGWWQVIIYIGERFSQGGREASSASSLPLRIGSTISRSPSLWMSASPPSSSNSRGMRSAWLRPLRKRGGVHGVQELTFGYPLA